MRKKFNKIYLLPALLIFIWGCAGKSGSVDDPVIPPPSGDTTIKGRVLTAQGAPISSASVIVDSTTTTTDINGSFLVSPLPEGKRSLSVLKDSFLIAGLITTLTKGETKDINITQANCDFTTSQSGSRLILSLNLTSVHSNLTGCALKITYNPSYLSLDQGIGTKGVSLGNLFSAGSLSVIPSSGVIDIGITLVGFTVSSPGEILRVNFNILNQGKTNIEVKNILLAFKNSEYLNLSATSINKGVNLQ